MVVFYIQKRYALKIHLRHKHLEIKLNFSFHFQSIVVVIHFVRVVASAGVYAFTAFNAWRVERTVE